METYDSVYKLLKRNICYYFENSHLSFVRKHALFSVLFLLLLLLFAYHVYVHYSIYDLSRLWLKCCVELKLLS